MTGSPYFAAIICASLLWVTYCWITRLIQGKESVSEELWSRTLTLLGTPGYLVTNAVYLVSVTLCTYNFYKGITTDPGFVPKAVSDTEIKMVSHYLGWSRKFD